MNPRSPNYVANSTAEAVSLPKIFVEKTSAAETALLGALLLCDYLEDAAERVDLLGAVLGDLAESDFLVGMHRQVFRSMRRSFEIHGGVAAPLVLSSAKDLGVADSISLSSLAALQSVAESPRDLDSYVKLVKESSRRRKLIAHLQDSLRKAQMDLSVTSEDVAATVESGISAIVEVDKKGKGLVALSDALKNNLDVIDDMYHRAEGSKLAGFTTGFDDLDDTLAGLQKQDLVIVAARPSMGKTAFALNLAKNLSEREKLPTLVFSCEMPADLLSMRLLGSESMINLQNLRRGQVQDGEWGRIGMAVEGLRDVPIYIDEPATLTPAGLRRVANKLVRQTGPLGAIFIDYMQLMSSGTPTQGREQEVGLISRELKKIAREFDCPVVALSQLNRSLENRPNKRPIMSDLRESGSIEQDADVILFIYRDEVYNPDTMDRGTAEIIIGKQRNGPIGTVRLGYDSRFVKFSNYMGPQGGFE